MKSYYRIMLGKKSKYALDCFEGNFIGAGLEIEKDFSNDLPDNWREFNQKYVPVYQELFPEKSKISAGLTCGFFWTIAKGIAVGDILLCPDGAGNYHIAEVIGGYSYDPSHFLCHRRPVRWLEQVIPREAMSDPLKYSAGSLGTVCNISKYADEIESLLVPESAVRLITSDLDIENPASFVLEKHLQDFLVGNWSQTELGKKYDIYEEDGELVGQQYSTDTGPLDVLAISKDKSELLVIELKRGRAADSVVGQTLRYMGYVQESLAEPEQKVCGAIIALEDDIRIRRALSIVSDRISFYRYKIDFSLDQM